MIYTMIMLQIHASEMLLVLFAYCFHDQGKLFFKQENIIIQTSLKQEIVIQNTVQQLQNKTAKQHWQQLIL